jgi:hypothetical protein
VVLEVLAQDNHKKTTANGVGSLGSGQSQKHQRMVLEVLAQDNHKKTTSNGVGSLGSGQSQKNHSEWCWKSWLRTITKRPLRCGLFAIVLSQDFQHHSLWSFCDCPEQPRLPTPFAVVFV